MTERFRAWLAAPLLAAFAVLRVAAANPGQYFNADLLITLAVTVGIVGAVAAAAHVSLVRMRTSVRAVRAIDILVVLATALFFWGVPFGNAFRDATGIGITARYLIIISFVGIATAVGFALARGSEFNRAARLVTMASAVLATGSCAQVLVQGLMQHRALDRDRVVAAANRPVPRATAFSDSAQRDIYLLVLDSRANSRILQEHFGFDDREFTDSLRHLGFVVPKTFSSNYVHTALSLSSLLNFTHVDQLALAHDEGTAWALVRALVERNRAAVFLKSRGYRYHLFPSEWFVATARSELADETLHAMPTWDPEQVLGSEFRRAVFYGTPLTWIPRDLDPTAHPRASFAGLARIANDPRPTFGFAHFLLPHAPYVFGDDCLPNRRVHGGDVDVMRRLYVVQVQCTNRLVLSAVTEILARSERTPIIAIVGDHGSRAIPLDMGAIVEGPVPALEERFGAFGAFLTPGAPELFADDLTLVNVMQRVLVEYHGADLTPSADRFFAAGATTLFEIQEVDAALATGDAHEGAPPAR